MIHTAHGTYTHVGGGWYERHDRPGGGLVTRHWFEKVGDQTQVSDREGDQR